MSLLPMRPLLWFTRILGLNPTGSPPDFKVSRRNTIASLCISISSLLTAGFLILSEMYRLIVTTITDPSPFFGTIIHINGMAVVFLGHTGTAAGAIQKARYLPQVLRDCNALPGPSRDWKSTTLYAVEIFLLSTVTLSIHPLITFHLKDTVVGNMGNAVLLLMIQSTADQLLFLHLVRHVGNCFQGINSRLSTLCEIASVRSSREARFSSSRRPLPLISEELCRQRELHISASDLVCRLTITQEMQIMTMLVVEFVLTVVLFYAMSIALYSRLAYMAFIILFGAIVVFSFVLVTVAVIMACRSTARKGNETVDVVHDMLNCDVFEESEVQQLIFFSMQAAHAKVAVVPHGLFNMDISLMQGFATTVIMYVVILLQFGSPIMSAPARPAVPILNLSNSFTSE